MSPAAPHGYAFRGFLLDVQHRVLLDQEGRSVLLAPKAFDMLVCLVERAGEVVEKRALLNAVWPHAVVEENNLNQHISTLRRVLGERPGEHRFIVTEPGRGYRFVAPVAPWTENEHGRESGDAPSAVAAATAFRIARRYGLAALALVVFVCAAVWLPRSEAPVEPAGMSAGPVAADAPPRAVLPGSIAVLPFDDLSPEPSRPYIAQGLHNELIGRLVQNGFNVLTRDAVLEYGARRPAYAEIAARLGVQLLLIGTARYAADEVVVNVSLVEPLTGVVLWAPPPYRSGFNDLFAVQGEIAADVADALNANLAATEQRRLALRPTVSVDAQRAYYRASAAQEQGRRSEALAFLEEAVRIDPRFAAAYAQLAFASARSLTDFVLERALPIEPERLAEQTTVSARRALRLDPTLAAAHIALGELYMVSWRWTEAADVFASAFRLGGGDAEVLGFYSAFNTYRGDFQAALALAQRYFELKPPAPDAQATGTGSLFYIWLAHVYSGNLDKAIEYLEEHLDIHPRQLPARLNLGFMHARREDRAAAERAFAQVETATRGARSPTFTANLAYGYSRVGRQDIAAALFQEVAAMARERAVAAGTWVAAYLAVGREQDALNSFDDALRGIDSNVPDAGWFSLMLLKHNLTADPLLETPPFKDRRAHVRGR